MGGGSRCRCPDDWILAWDGASWIWYQPGSPDSDSNSSSISEDSDYSSDGSKRQRRRRQSRSRRSFQSPSSTRRRSVSPRRRSHSTGHQSRKSRYDESQKTYRTTTLKILRTETLAEQDANFLRLKNSPELQQEWNKQHPPGHVIAYTDGSCIDQKSSGFGVYFGPEHELNRAVRIEGRHHNSCLAEILAALRALELIREWKNYQQEPVIIRTDFLPLVQSMNKGAKAASVFADEYQLLWSVAKKMPSGVEFQHVYGHGDDPGNQAADELARQAALSRDPERRARSAGSRVKDMTGHRGRSASRDNNREHIRSHSAFVGRRK